jgi:hypothetical protein
MPVGAEGESRADPGKHQELRGTDYVCGQHDFTGGPGARQLTAHAVFDANASLPVDQQAMGERPGHDAEIAARPRGP